MVQIRNVPDELHRRLKARAALEGKTLSDFLLAEVERLLERPSLAELKSRISARVRVKPGVSAARAVREERESR
jgi:plasmid stability protein